MGVGSIGDSLRTYEESDTFLSTDAGVTWSMVLPEAHKYEFGDQGGIILAVNDEETVGSVSYSTDLGRTWYVIPMMQQERHSIQMQENSRARRARPCAGAIDRPGLNVTKVLVARTALPPGRNG